VTGTETEREREKAVRRRNWALFAALAASAMLLYAATLLRIGG
jgi:hypothetical protein